MLQRTPQRRLLLATEPGDFRKGSDGLAALCRPVLADNPLRGTLFVFRHRAGTALTLLCYDGQGFRLCTTRLSQGRCTWWPQRQDASYRLWARERRVLLWNGPPHQAGMAEDWRKLASGGTRRA